MKKMTIIIKNDKSYVTELIRKCTKKLHGLLSSNKADKRVTITRVIHAEIIKFKTPINA